MGIEYNQSSINQSENGWIRKGIKFLLALSVITNGINAFKIACGLQVRAHLIRNIIYDGY